MKGARRAVLLTLAGVLLLGTVIIAVLNRVEGGKRDALVAELRAEGVLLDRKAIASTRPAGTEFFSGPWESSLYGFLYSAEAGGAMGTPDNADPKKWTWFETAKDPHRVFDLKPGEDADVRRVVAEQGELIAKLKALTAQAPVSPEELYSHTMSSSNLWAAKIPNLLAVRSFANLLTLDAYVNWRDGNPDAALVDCCAILRLGRHTADTPWLISQMIAIAVSAIGMQCLQRIGPDAAYSDAAMAEMDGLLARLFEQDLLAKSFQAEMLSMKEAFDNISGRGPVPPAEMGEGLGNLGMNRLSRAFVRLYATPVLSFMQARDEAMAMRVMALFVALNRLPFHERDLAQAEFGGIVTGFPWHTPLTSLMLPNALRSAIQTADARALLDQGRIALALNRHKRVHGAYPDTLEALVPTFLPEIPEDPYTGGTMPYKNGPEGYLLWSVGNDRKDEALKKAEGGPPPLVRNMLSFRYPNCDDIVWSGAPVNN